MTGLVPYALNQMVSVFAARGFKRVQGTVGLGLQGAIEVKGISFELLVTELDPSFEQVPHVYLKAIPKGLPLRLPHVEHDLKLCYLDPESVFLDPLHPYRTSQIVLGAIEHLLTTFVDGSDEYKQREIAREFYSYWHSEAPCFLTTKQKNAIGSFYRRRSSSGLEGYELAIASDSDRMAFWKGKRKFISTEEDELEYGSIIIELKNPPTITDELPEWPPSSWATFLAWLLTFDPSAEQSLISNLHLALQKHYAVVVVLESKITGPFAVGVVFSKVTFKRASGFNMSSRKGVQKRSKNWKSNKGRAPGFKEFRDYISKDARVVSFLRMKAFDVTGNFIVERNLRVPSLHGKKIAVIGCGTIGGFVADLLVKAGAGTGDSGELLLFDGDQLGTGNLGRHILGVEYLGEYKAQAMEAYLKDKTPYPFKVRGFLGLDVSYSDRLCEFDLVIDLSGDENFSTRFSYETHRIRREGGAMPPILHYWIDAGGRVVRGLFDDGSNACYRCLRQYKNNDSDPEELEERFPIYLDLTKENENVAIQRCGDSYIPFPAAMSVVAAGQVQSIVLDYFSGVLKDTFYHYSTNHEIRVTKNQKLKRISSCLCCKNES